MSYERLQITDFVDKWDVEKVKHLEDGIITNEEAIANLDTKVETLTWSDLGYQFTGEEKEVLYLEENTFTSSAKEYGGRLDTRLTVGDTCRVKMYGELRTVFGSDHLITIDDSYSFYIESSEGMSGFKLIYNKKTNKYIIELINEEVLEGSLIITVLDYKESVMMSDDYIPDSIARIADLETLEAKVDNKQIEEYFKPVVVDTKYVFLLNYQSDVTSYTLPENQDFSYPLELRIGEAEGARTLIINKEDLDYDTNGYMYYYSSDTYNIEIYCSYSKYGFETTIAYIDVNRSQPVYKLVDVVADKVLDEKYIDEAIARKSDLSTLSNELARKATNTDLEVLDAKVESLTWSDLGDIEDQVVFVINNDFSELVSNGIEGTSLSVGDKCKVTAGTRYVQEYLVTIDESYSFEALSDPILRITYNKNDNKYSITQPYEEDIKFECEGPLTITKLGGSQKIDEKYIPDTIARAPKAIFNDIEEAPTASDFNTLLSILREAGILTTE